MANGEHGAARDAPGTERTGGTEARIAAARVALWLFAAALAVRQAAAVPRTPHARRPTDPGSWPLTRSGEQVLGWASAFGTLALVVVLGLVAARALPRPVSRRTSLLAAPVAIGLLMLSLPVRDTPHLGQTGVIPVLLVLLGLFAVRGERTGGLLVGVGAALHPALLLFAVLLWRTGRGKAAAFTGVGFALCAALARAAMRHDSWTYWIHHLAGAGPGAHPYADGDQSLHGMLLRLGLQGPLETGLFLALGAAVVLAGLRRAVRYANDGQLLLAVAVTGCVVAAVSPTSWRHQLLWVLLTAAGRVGTRRSDRYVWPVAVVLVSTLPATMLLPDMPVTEPLRANAVLLAALAAAVAVPFLPRTHPRYRAPLPTEYAAPVPARWRRVPLIPLRRRALTRPNLLLELLLIRVGYAAYQQVRLAATGGTISGGRAVAEHHGEQIHAIERFLHIDIEHRINHAVVRAGRPEEFFDFYYTSFHFAVPLGVLAVLYARRPADYRWARSALGFATVLALVGFWAYPLAPPRLMPDLGFVDTVHGVQDFTKPDYGTLTELTNQYAAMPSLHFGWSLWCGLVVAVLAPKGWMKALGLLHPLLTLSAVVATGNHWLLDAVGGAAVVGAGFGLTHLLSGPRAHRPRDANHPREAVAGAQAPPVTGTTKDAAKDRSPR
ncbi:phosphatase PAP2 family protein [Streptomyces sp. G44]|uniref:bifunctional glycosyltransferase 87/phosphatase PAP2 family protein n=1 Tax=Streptomyces sp. G44 TaxID=2807632 RepID=UPI001961C8A5|nr:bifunctional glycosyltransferase 87/phosphatase PAP2 family protein [Streptomyces sp. G44]MBM7167367.1 phosphatase PAP2 family protein [Streptomyces sp. G44]